MNVLLPHSHSVFSARRGALQPRLVLQAAVTLACLGMQPLAHADLFGDNEARRAILDLRQRFQAMNEDNARMRNSLLELQNQIDALKADTARMRGHD